MLGGYLIPNAGGDVAVTDLAAGYVPAQDHAWACQSPDAAGFDPGALARAVAFACEHPTSWPTDIVEVIEGGTFDPPPWNRVLGPTQPRGGPCGVVVSGGRLVAEWGDTRRPDMVFSVTKSYLGVLAGVALDAGLIGDPREPVRRASPHPALETAQNRDVSWLDLLHQSSELEVELWGIPDTVDRNRQLSPQEDGSRFDRPHQLQRPGAYWDYNDIRVNFLCLALTRLFGRPLGDVWQDAVFGPLSATPGWHWWGLHGSDTEVDGRQVACAVGGGHWGGGLVTSARHDARLGLLVSRRGRWGERQIVSPGWIDAMLRPCPLNPVYGALWWLNTDRMLHRAASAGSVFAFGVGMNAVWVDPAIDLVVVTRWIERTAFDCFVTMLADSRHG